MYICIYLYIHSYLWCITVHIYKHTHTYIQTHTQQQQPQQPGLESVKREFRKELVCIEIGQEQDRSTNTFIYNARFDGNPGTGKTTVARLYSKFLVQLGILPGKAEMIETSGPKLANGGIPELEKLLEKGKARGGACVFIDEAYALNPRQDRTGGQVLDFILPHAEKLEGQYGKVVFVLAGYAKDMDKLFEHNPGLPSRFPRRFVFEDYTEEELLSIFKGLLANPNGVHADNTNKKKEAKPLADVDVPFVANSNSNSNSSMHRGFPSARGYGIRGNYPGNVLNNNAKTLHGTTARDQWGHEWQYDGTALIWTDEYQNQSGYGPIDASNPLGAATNPVYRPAQDGSTLTPWVFDDSLRKWHPRGDKDAATVTYPGAPAGKGTPFTLSDEKWGRIAMRRLARMRGKIGFGNARAVKNLFDNALRRQAERIAREREQGRRPDIYVLARDDVLGPRADEEALGRCQALQELMCMEGLDKVKETVRGFLRLVVDNACREEEEKPLNDVILNRIFLGNPGTGKTTVAKLYGRILCDFGLLSKGDVILKNPSDFTGMAFCDGLCVYMYVCVYVCLYIYIYIYIYTHTHT